MPSPEPWQVCWWGRMPYQEAYTRQQQLVVRRIAGEIPDTLLLLEHDPVFTIGRSGSRSHLLVSEAQLEQEGVGVYEVNRGGDITYHGPGQLVGYPIFDLNRHVRDLHRVLHLYEEALLRAIGSFGLQGERLAHYPGVWVQRQKVAALGIAVRHWVTFHGFALNVNPQLDWFAKIVPCGITELGVTSMSELLGRELTLDAVISPVIANLAAVFGFEPAVTLQRWGGEH